MGQDFFDIQYIYKATTFHSPLVQKLKVKCGGFFPLVCPFAL